MVDSLKVKSTNEKNSLSPSRPRPNVQTPITEVAPVISGGAAPSVDVPDAEPWALSGPPGPAPPPL